MKRQLSIIATRREIELSTSFDYPPIPARSFDWSAIDANTFDADWDGHEWRYVTSCPIGSGATEQEAIDDLFDKMEER